MDTKLGLLAPSGGEYRESGTTHAVAWERLGNMHFLDIYMGLEAVTCPPSGG